MRCRLERAHPQGQETDAGWEARLREAQVPDEGSAFLGGTGSAKHTLHPGLSPAEEGSRGCSHPAHVGATSPFRELQSTLAKKVITHRSHQLRCGGRDDVHTNSGLILFFFFSFDMRYLVWLCQSYVHQSQLDAGVSSQCHNKNLHWFLQNKCANRFWQVFLLMPCLDSIQLQQYQMFALQ